MTYDMITRTQTDEIFDLIKECGRIMLSAHSIENTSDGVSEKDGIGNFVTAYDVKVQNTLIEGLSKTVPGARFIAEEKENSENELADGFCFVIDPIDGTCNFIHDLRSSGISVGLFQNAKPVFSAIYNPYSDEMFYALAGKGAFLNGNPIAVSGRPLDKALVAFGTAPYYREELCDRSFAMAKNIYMKTSDLRRFGAATVEICNIACGRTDAFFELSLSPWDYAAGYLILTEAGGKLTDFTGKAPSFCKPSSVLCTNGSLHKQILEIINLTEEKYNGR